jgi:PIN domain nuclease of toxin-antitoxin system
MLQEAPRAVPGTPQRNRRARRGDREFPELIRHDPFDRLIVAQASRVGLRLLTADHVLLDLRRDFILDASR